MKKGKGAVLFGVIIQTFEQKLLQLSFTLGPIFEGCRGKIIPRSNGLEKALTFLVLFKKQLPHLGRMLPFSGPGARAGN